MADNQNDNTTAARATDDLFMPEHTYEGPRSGQNLENQHDQPKPSEDVHTNPRTDPVQDLPKTSAEVENTQSSNTQQLLNESSPGLRVEGNLQEANTPIGPSHVDSISSMKFNSSFDQLGNEKVESPTQKVTNSVLPNQTGAVEEKKAEEAVEEDLTTRINKTIAFKENAKFFVKGGLWEDAIKIYEASFFHLKLTARDGMDPNFRKGLQLQNDILNNLSLCYGSIERYHESIQYAKRVLVSDHNNVKALFRLAIGYKQMGSLLAAFDEIKKCKDAFKAQNPGQPIDAKIQELYVSLREECKDILNEQEKKEKEVYSKMMGNSRTKEAEKKEEKSAAATQGRSPLSYKPVRYMLYLGPTIIMGVIAARIIRQKSIEAAKNHIPAILTTIGAVLCIRYLKNNVRKSVLGLGLASLAGLMVARIRYRDYWSGNPR